MYPSRMTVPELADVWKVTRPRVYQLISAGKLQQGPDGKVDREEAFAYRASALSENQARVMFQSYGNAHGPIPPKFTEHLAEDRVLTADEVIGIEPEAPAVSPQAAVADAASAHANISRLRARELEFKLQGLDRKARKDAGELIERSVVHRAGQEAAAEIAQMVGTLPHEIAALFEDHDIKSDVRSRVERVVDRCLFAMGRKFKALALEEPQDEDWDDDV